MIKHLVINGGGPTAFISYGVIRHLCQQEYLDMNSIQSIYATSSGAVIAALVSLKYDWNVLDDYIIKRPWDQVFQLQPEDFFRLFQLSCLTTHILFHIFH